MEHTAKETHLDVSAISASYGFIPGLNGLRATSITLVLVGHFIMPEKYRGLSALGVFLFFAISGFLITRLLYAEVKKYGSVDIVGFFFRRYLRLYPVICIYMAAVLAIFFALGRQVSGIEIVSVFSYFTNYLENYRLWHGQTLQMPVGQFWSLAVEEHFYLIMPFFFVAVKGDPKRVLIASIIMCIVPLVVRIGYVVIWPQVVAKELVYRPSLTRFDGIAVGVALAALCELRRGRDFVLKMSSTWAFLLGCALIIITLIFKGQVFGDTLRYSLRSLACVMIIAGMVFGPNLALVQKISNAPIADWLGKISYSLYVWQGGAHLFLEVLHIPANSLHGFSMVAVSFVLAVGSYYFVEQPTLKFKSLRKRSTKAMHQSFLGLSPVKQEVSDPVGR